MSDTQAYYERYWADPDTAPPAVDPTTPVRRAMLKEALRDLPPGSRVLDMGCGTGEFTQYLGELGMDATGIDLSERAIAVAGRRFKDRTFRAGPPEAFLAEWGGRFQAVWSSEVIEHVFDVYAFLAALNRLMAQGGRLVLTTPYHGLIKNLAISLAGYANHYDPFGGHIRFFDKRNLGRCLRHCGFTPRKWSAYGRTWPLYKSFFVVSEKTHDVGAMPAADS